MTSRLQAHAADVTTIMKSTQLFNRMAIPVRKADGETFAVNPVSFDPSGYLDISLNISY